jgi:hypothetical protein
MLKYYINNKEVTKEEAIEAQRRNVEYMNSGDWELIKKCDFVIAIEK